MITGLGEKFKGLDKDLRHALRRTDVSVADRKTEAASAATTDAAAAAFFCTRECACICVRRWKGGARSKFSRAP